MIYDFKSETAQSYLNLWDHIALITVLSNTESI